MSDKLNILITFHLKPEFVERIKQVDTRYKVYYEPELFGKPRYLNDQHGEHIQRTPEQEARWLELLKKTDILFGYIGRSYITRLSELAPRLKWNQSPSAGIGQMVNRSGNTESDIIFTTARASIKPSRIQ